MSLRKEIQLFLDADGLVSPYNLEWPGKTTNASGNGVLYLGELVVIQRLRGELTEDDCANFHDRIEACMPVERGLLHRSPTHPDQQGPDDYVGMLAGAWATGNTELAQWVIDYAWRNWGFMNNENPGTFRHKDGRMNWSAFLIRQPQLIALAYWAAGRKPFFLLRMYAAATIALAGFRKEKDDTDPRLLGWLLTQVGKDKSFMCRLAAKIFERRLLKDYPNGMLDVAEIYFGKTNPKHPFCTYWPKV